MGVRIAYEGGIKMVEVPVGSDEFAMEGGIGIVRDGGGGTTAHVCVGFKWACQPSANTLSVGFTTYPRV